MELPVHSVRLPDLFEFPDGEGTTRVVCPTCGEAKDLLLRWQVGHEQDHTLSCRQRHEWTDPRICPLGLRRLSHAGTPPTARGPWRTEVGNPVRVREGRWPRWRTITCPACQGRTGIGAERDRGVITLECECMHRWPHPLGHSIHAWVDLEMGSATHRRARWWGQNPLLALAAGMGYWWGAGAPWGLLVGVAWTVVAVLYWFLLRWNPRVEVRAELGRLLGDVFRWQMLLLICAMVGAGVFSAGRLWGVWLVVPMVLLAFPVRSNRRGGAAAPR